MRDLLRRPRRCPQVPREINPQAKLRITWWHHLIAASSRCLEALIRSDAGLVRKLCYYIALAPGPRRTCSRLGEKSPYDRFVTECAPESSACRASKYIGCTVTQKDMTNLLRERVGGSGASFTSYIFLFLHPTIMARKGNKDDKKKKAAAKAAEAKNKLRNLAKSRAPNVAEMEEAARAQAQLYLKKAQRARCRKSHSDGTTLPRAPVVEEMEEAPLAQARLFMKKAQRLGAAKAIQMDQSYMSMKGIMFVLKRHKYRIADCQADLANLKAEHKTYFRKFASAPLSKAT
ncbi:hypothetical protein BDZ88DRAFT_412014 [Geranomyces variabilis]|nr:hypothetical protein BDZ88DRAFT_412014 [Geranomyces variabilis]